MPHDRKPKQRAENSDKRTPGSAGHPEPGSGHDDSRTVTVNEGPPRRIVEGVPGAYGEKATERNVAGNLPERDPVES